MNTLQPDDREREPGEVTNVNRLVLTVVFVAATFLLMNAPNLSSSQAFGCSNSTNTNTNHTAGVNGTSGNITKSAFTGPGQISIVNVADKISVGRGPCGVAKAPDSS